MKCHTRHISSGSAPFAKIEKIFFDKYKSRISHFMNKHAVICVSVRRTVCTHVRSYIHIKAHASVCLRAHIRVFASMNFPDESMSAHMHTNIHTFKYTDSRTRLHARLHTWGHMHDYIQTSKLEKSGMFILYIHTYIHTNLLFHTDARE